MGQVQVHLDNSSLDQQCVGQRYWYAFFISSLLTFFGGLFIICFWRLTSYFLLGKIGRKFKESVIFLLFTIYYYDSNFLNFQIHFKFKKKETLTLIENTEPEIAWVTSAKDFCGELISGKLMRFYLMLNIKLKLC